MIALRNNEGMDLVLIKFGCIKDAKFSDKMDDYILFKNLDGKYLTLPECLEIKPQNEEENKENAVDENGNKVEAEVVEDKAEDEASEENTEEEKKEKIIYYVTDEQQQSQYINMFKAEGMDALIMTQTIDSPFITLLEQKNENVHFYRIDAELSDNFVGEELSEETAKEYKDKLTATFEKALDMKNLNVKVESLKDENTSSILTQPEETRRMQEMMKMYGMAGMDPSMFGQGEGETLILNSNNKLVKYVLDNPDSDNTATICCQLYDLAVLANRPLSAEAMTKFIARSNEILGILTK